MDPNYDNKEVQTPSVEFFIGELSRMESDMERRYASLSRRVLALEDGRGRSFEENPMSGIMGMIGLMMLAELVVPLILEGVRAWRSQSSPSSQ